MNYKHFITVAVLLLSANLYSDEGLDSLPIPPSDQGTHVFFNPRDHLFENGSNSPAAKPNLDNLN